MKDLTTKKYGERNINVMNNVKLHARVNILSKDLLKLFCYRYGPPTRTENRLIVENLSSRVSWQVCILSVLGFFFLNRFQFLNKI